MDLKLLITLLIPTVVAVASWFVGSWLSVRRDLSSKRRDTRVDYLIEAYRRLESGSNRTPTPSSRAAIESAIADVQLFGSAKQVAAAQEFGRLMAESGEASLDALLIDLRNDLRSELQLEPVTGRLKFIRFVSADK